MPLFLYGSGEGARGATGKVVAYGAPRRAQIYENGNVLGPGESPHLHLMPTLEALESLTLKVALCILEAERDFPGQNPSQSAASKSPNESLLSGNRRNNECGRHRQ
jgi:hypothetical protein